LRHDRIAADGVGECWIDCDGFRKNPHEVKVAQDVILRGQGLPYS
jgi:hypothetical protein